MPAPTPEQNDAIRQELDRYAWLLDECVRIPGTRIRLGLDSVIGLIPGLGDVATGAMALLLVWRAHRLGAPGALVGRMLKNVGIDVLIGSVPILGDIFDVTWRANRRNVNLLREYFHPGSSVSSPALQSRWFFGLVAISMLAIILPLLFFLT